VSDWLMQPGRSGRLRIGGELKRKNIKLPLYSVFEAFIFVFFENRFFKSSFI
jgi:hypothetical protein